MPRVLNQYLIGKKIFTAVFPGKKVSNTFLSYFVEYHHLSKRENLRPDLVSNSNLRLVVALPKRCRLWQWGFVTLFLERPVEQITRIWFDLWLRRILHMSCSADCSKKHYVLHNRSMFDYFGFQIKIIFCFADGDDKVVFDTTLRLSGFRSDGGKPATLHFFSSFQW